MKRELTREELEMVNGGLTLWDIIFDAGERAFTWLDEKVVEPVINDAKLATKVVVNDVVDEVVELGYKVYDVI